MSFLNKKALILKKLSIVDKSTPIQKKVISMLFLVEFYTEYPQKSGKAFSKEILVLIQRLYFFLKQKLFVIFN